MKKKTIVLSSLILALSLMLFSCSNFRKDENVIDSDKMNGKYELDLTPLIGSFVKEDGALLGLALSSIKVNVSFYENNKGVLELNSKLVSLATVFSDKPIERVYEFDYKIENDSVFHLKTNKDEEYKQRATVRKMGDNYDYLQFSVMVEDRDDIFLNLVKIGE